MAGMNTAPLAQSETCVREMEIVETDYLVNHDGSTAVLEMRAQFTDVPFDPHGHPFLLSFRLEDRNPFRQEIGQRDFAGLRRATGVLAPDDSEDLLFKPFRAIVANVGKRVVIKQYLWGTTLGPQRDERGRFRRAA